MFVLYVRRRQWRHSPARAQTRRPPPPKGRLMDKRFCTTATPSVTLLAVMAKVPRSASAVETLSSTSKRLFHLYFMFLNSCIIVMYKIIIWLFYIVQTSTHDGHFLFCNKCIIVFSYFVKISVSLLYRHDNVT